MLGIVRHSGCVPKAPVRVNLEHVVLAPIGESVLRRIEPVSSRSSRRAVCLSVSPAI